MGGKSLVSMALRSKFPMSRVGSCAFEEAIGEADNGGNFNDDLDE